MKSFAESFSQASLETKISELQADIKMFDSQIAAVQGKIDSQSAQLENRTKIALKITERDRKIDSLSRLYSAGFANLLGLRSLKLNSKVYLAPLYLLWHNSSNKSMPI